MVASRKSACSGQGEKQSKVVEQFAKGFVPSSAATDSEKQAQRTWDRSSLLQVDDNDSQVGIFNAYAQNANTDAEGKSTKRGLGAASAPGSGRRGGMGMMFVSAGGALCQHVASAFLAVPRLAAPDAWGARFGSRLYTLCTSAAATQSSEAAFCAFQHAGRRQPPPQGACRASLARAAVRPTPLRAAAAPPMLPPGRERCRRGGWRSSTLVAVRHTTPTCKPASRSGCRRLTPPSRRRLRRLRHWRRPPRRRSRPAGWPPLTRPPGIPTTATPSASRLNMATARHPASHSPGCSAREQPPRAAFSPRSAGEGPPRSLGRWPCSPSQAALGMRTPPHTCTTLSHQAINLTQWERPAPAPPEPPPPLPPGEGPPLPPGEGPPLPPSDQDRWRSGQGAQASPSPSLA